nr:CCR4-NOT transcription complex subunit 10-like isoform X2 [Halyomorpha halys]
MMAPTLTPETFSAIMRKSKSLFSRQKYEEALEVMILIQEDTENFAKMKLNEAFFYLREAAQGMHRSPLVWLRLAECCILFYKRGQEGEFSVLKNGNLLANSKVGSGLSSKIVLNSKFCKDSGYPSSPQCYQGDGPSLGFASICLKNAYLLLPVGNNRLKQAVLAASSYVHLTIGNPVIAHKYADILAEDSCHVYKYLSKLYLAESLVFLNRIGEAIELLKMTYINDYDSFENLQEDDWFSNINTTSHYVLNYNLIVSLTLNGQFHEASELLRTFLRLKVSINEVPIHIVALALYIELATGHVDAARSIIKQQCPQLFQ